MEVTHGNPIMTIKGAAAQFALSEKTVRNLLGEMDAHKNRYGDHFTIGEGKLKRINILAFTDYVTYRELLKDTKVSKKIPPYEPAETARELGFYE